MLAKQRPGFYITQVLQLGSETGANTGLTKEYGKRVRSAPSKLQSRHTAFLSPNPEVMHRTSRCRRMKQVGGEHNTGVGRREYVCVLGETRITAGR